MPDPLYITYPPERFQPIGDRVLVRCNPDPERSDGGIFLAGQNPDPRFRETGTVVAVGPGKVNGDGERVPCCAKVGDVVVLQLAPDERVRNLNFGGVMHRLVADRDLPGRVV